MREAALLHPVPMRSQAGLQVSSIVQSWRAFLLRAIVFLRVGGSLGALPSVGLGFFHSFSMLPFLRLVFCTPEYPQQKRHAS